MKRFAALLSSILILLLTGCGVNETASAPELLDPVGVQIDVAQAKKDTIYNIASYKGEIAPYVEELQFVADGRVGQINVSLGDTVQKGQVLVTLNEETIRNQLDSLDKEKAEINKMGSFSDQKMTIDIEIAKTELEQLRQSGASDRECSLKENDVQKLETQLRQTQQLRQLQLQELQRKWDALQEKLENTQLVAPFSGNVVYIKSMKIGDSVQGYTTVICLADESRADLVTEYIAESVIEGAKSIYMKTADKEYDVEYIPYDPDEYTSKVLKGETLKSRFSLNAQEGELKVGQFAVLLMIDSYKEDVLTIPVNALHQDKSVRYVYKIEDGKRVRCDVTVGIVTDTKAEIKEGLKEGDVVYVKE